MKDIYVRILGVIFIIIALHRMVLKKEREQELLVFGLPKYSDYLIILCELIIGILLLSNIFNIKKVLQFFLLFLVCACIIIFFRNYKKILSTYNDIWTFQPTAMSLALHFYIILIVLMLLYK